MRVLCGDDIALGPGKVDLLALIGETGSIREAAERMGMSYMRAWTLIKTVNACFREPLVMASRGGKERHRHPDRNRHEVLTSAIRRRLWNGWSP